MQWRPLFRNIPGNHFSKRLSQSQGYSTAGKIMLMRYSDTIGYRTRELPAFNVVSQPTLRRAPEKNYEVLEKLF